VVFIHFYFSSRGKVLVVVWCGVVWCGGGVWVWRGEKDKKGRKKE